MPVDIDGVQLGKCASAESRFGGVRPANHSKMLNAPQSDSDPICTTDRCICGNRWVLVVEKSRSRPALRRWEMPHYGADLSTTGDDLYTPVGVEWLPTAVTRTLGRVVSIRRDARVYLLRAEQQ